MSASTDTPLPADDAKRIAAVLESLPHNAKLGIRMVELAPGRCTTYIEFRPELIGDPSRRVLHGGVVTTLIDATAGAAVYASIPGERSLATLDMRIDYLKPAEPDQRLHASAELYRLTRRIAFVRASAYQDDPGNQVAHCAASFMIGSLGLSMRAPIRPMPGSVRDSRRPGPREGFPGLDRDLPYAGFIHLDVEVEDGRALTILRKDAGNVGNPVMPMIHGGAVGALLEHAALMQLFFELGLGLDRRPKIVNISIDYLRPCLLEDTFARGVIIRQGRRVANVRVDAWQSDPGKLVAAAHAHFLLPGE